MFERDVDTWATLVSCYANHGSIETACQLFKEMPEKSCGSIKDAIHVFEGVQMLIARAVKFMNNMSLKASAAIWGAILKSCRV
ncbi:hypothetical protein MKW94_012149 [Papaver nudicaule]|uniref:Pentatricopeptide repeat-containing protein n=1 Tax=Papaver nudicaule TaxID=74823 RepID=A0AA41V1K1_PAPNU|nr:hypothetical protein [Papaver nudicaule]